jgi:hypothetical protein
MPLKVLLGAGLAKSVCKILMSNNLEIKILRTWELEAATELAPSTPASAMIAQMWGCAQGQMSQGGCGKLLLARCPVTIR